MFEDRLSDCLLSRHLVQSMRFDGSRCNLLAHSYNRVLGGKEPIFTWAHVRAAPTRHRHDHQKIRSVAILRIVDRLSENIPVKFDAGAAQASIKRFSSLSSE